jgi:hypothetical protein
LRALARDPAARHQTIRELRAELREINGERVMTTVSAPALDAAMLRDAERRLAERDAAAKAAQPVGDPDWLERGAGHLAPAFSPVSAPVPVPSLPEPSRAQPTQREVATWMREIVQTTDLAVFAALVPRLEARIRFLAAQAEAVALSGLATTLDVVATEGPPVPKSRAARARELLRLFTDPQLLAPLAERVLDLAEDPEGMASKMLVRAGTGGGYALYAALLKNRSFEARARFVAVVAQMGAHALPMLRAGLERLAVRLLTAPGAAPPLPKRPAGGGGARAPAPPPEAIELALDLLKAIPNHMDDAMGELLARYTRCSVLPLAVLAVKALPRVWGQRASAMLVGLLNHTADEVWVAAISAIHELGAIDAHVVRKVGPYATSRASSRRLAAVGALSHPAADGVGVARAVLSQAFAATLGPPPDSDDAVVAIARALLAAGGSAAAVSERCATAPPRLRTLLQALLRGVTAS